MGTKSELARYLEMKWDFERGWLKNNKLEEFNMLKGKYTKK